MNGKPKGGQQARGGCSEKTVGCVLFLFAERTSSEPFERHMVYLWRLIDRAHVRRRSPKDSP